MAKPKPRVDSRQAILAALQTPIIPPEPTGTYRFAVASVLFALGVLFFVYWGMIVLLGYSIYYHAIHHLPGTGHRTGGGWMLVFYALPLFAGTIILFFLIKPFFAPRMKSSPARTLQPAQEPFLFAFVERICQAVDAPRPKRIDIDLEVNASARLGDSFWGILGSDPILTIGLPLVVDLETRQLAGVLAHEFGHFSQHAGMRVANLIRFSTMWFARLVYERDQWDERLRSWAGHSNALAVIAWSGIVGVWITRKVLWCMMMAAGSLAGFLTRQMEYDADLCETRLAGSDTFVATQRKISLVSFAAQGAYADLYEFYKEGRLADNLPRLIQANTRQMPTDVKRKIFEALNARKTGFFDTHPSDSDRIDAAQRENSPGAFQAGGLAQELFSDFDGLARLATLDMYRQRLGIHFNTGCVHPVEHLLERQQEESATYKCLDRYFQGTFSAIRPLPFGSEWLMAPANAKANVATIKENRQRLVSDADKLRQLAKDHADATARLMNVLQAKAMVRAGVRFGFKEIGMKAATIEEARRVEEKAYFVLGRISTAMEELYDRNARRLHAVLELMHVPQVATRLPDVQSWIARCEDLLPMAGLLSRLVQPVTDVRNRFEGLRALFVHLERYRENQQYVQILVGEVERLHGEIAAVRELLVGRNYPFEHAKGEIPLTDYVVPTMPHPEDLGGSLEAAEAILERLPTLYARVIAQLVTYAESIEQVLGLPQLPEIKSVADEQPAAAT